VLAESPVIVIVAVAVYAALAVTALRHRLLARVAVREAIRRPIQSALVVAGLTVATGAILGPQIWSDSITDSLIAAGDREWGRVDLTVSAGGAPFSADVAERLGAKLARTSSIAGVQAGVDLTGSVSNASQGLDLAAVRLVGFDPAAQRAFGAYVLDDGTLTYGEALRPSEVILSRSLADSIKAKAGDRILVSVNGRARELIVAGVARPEGPGIYGLRPALFAPLPATSALAGSDLINVVRITATGDGQAESSAAREAAPIVRAMLANPAEGPALEVREVKAEEAVAFTKYQQSSHGVLLPGSYPAVIIGCALVVNLILSIADERRPRLGVLRALGLSRSGLVTLSLLEGGLYSLAAALASLVTGGLIVWAIFAYTATAQVSDVNGRDVVFQPSVRLGTVVSVIALGSLITMLTVFGTAMRTSQMTVASAIRNLPEPEPAPRRSWFRLTWLVLLAVSGALGLLATDPRLRLLGGCAVIVVAAALSRGHLTDRTRATVAGALMTAWGLAVLSSYTTNADNIAVAVQLYLWGAITAVFGLALILAANLRLLEGLASLLGNASTGLLATLRPPLAYMTRRPMRAGLTVGVLAGVVAFLSIWTLFEVGGLDYERDSGGFDVEVTSGGSQLVTLPPHVQSQVVRSISIPTRRYIGKERFSLGSGVILTDWHEQVVPLYELSDAIASEALPALSQRDASFSSDADALRAVASDPTWVISSWWGGPDGRVSLYGRDGPVEYKVAGSFPLGLLDGLVGNSRALTPFAGSPAGTTLLVDGQPSVDAGALALDVRRSMFSQGVEASTTKALLDEGQVQSHTWSWIFRLMSLIGLVVGVLTLGILALRSVLERRRAIGVLRALGSQRRSILAGILIEATLTTGLAIVVGLAAGLQSSYFFWSAIGKVGPAPELDAAYAGANLATVYGVLMVVAVLATIGPALMASRLTPVDALRSID
jgi:putative ABC transport system permease protein